MTDPQRLLDSTGEACDAFEADLLRAGRAEAMPPSAKRALVAAALGGTLAATAGAAGAGGAGAASASTAPAALAAKLGTGLFAKASVLGLLGVAVVVGGLWFTRSAPSVAVAPAVSLVVPVVSVAPVASVAVTPPTEDLPPFPVASTSAVASAPSVVASAPPARPRAIASSDLSAEVLLLEQAREAVARRDGAAALAVLAEHARTFPNPALDDEAFVLRIEALAIQGNGARVRTLAGPWLAKHPTSPYAPRVRRALESAP